MFCYGYRNLGRKQGQQLTTYIANIGEANPDLSAFNSVLQQTIVEKTPIALGHGINEVMLMSFAVCFFATLLCFKLLKQQTVQQENLILEYCHPE